MSFGLGFGFPKKTSASGGATLNLQFAGATALDPRITFTRASSATYYNSLGILVTAGIDVARLTYNPSTLAAQGLLIEEQRTNLLTYSELFDNAVWVKTNANITVSANTTVAPDGTSNADTATISTGGTDSRLNQGVAVANNSTSYTLTFYLKRVAAEAETRFDLRFAGGSSTLNYACCLNWSNLTINSVPGGSTPSGTSVTSVNNGWYRVSVTGANNSTGNTTCNCSLYPSTSSTGTVISSGSVFLWGAQLEAGAFPTSYIPTTSAQVTRAADSASMTGTNFSSWYNATEGSIYSEVVSAPVSNIVQQVYYISDNSSNNAMFLRRTTSATPSAAVVVGGVAQADVNSGTAAASSTYKFGFAYKVNDFAASLNAGAVGTDTSGTIPVVNQINLGSAFGTSQFLNGSIKKFVFYPRRLSNSELQALTL